MIGLRALYEYKCPFCIGGDLSNTATHFFYNNIACGFYMNFFSMWPLAGVSLGKTIYSIVGCEKHERNN